MKLNKIFTTVFLILYQGFVLAQTSDSAFPSGYYDSLALIFLLFIIVIFIGFIYYGTGEGKPKSLKTKVNKRLLDIPFVNKFITGTVPLEKEKDILMSDNFDGIQELDNKIPPWFNYLFYGSILFSVYYLLDYHVFGTSSLSQDEYALEMEEAKIQQEELAKSGAFITEETVALETDQGILEKGKMLYGTYCVTCHAEDGGGLVGPNLTDDYWINGAGIKNVFKTIKYGVPAKGMISWQQQFNPVQIKNIANYIISLHGTAPLKPKQPEGILHKEQDTLNTLSVK